MPNLLPVCTYTRAWCDHCFKPEVDCGFCAAKQLNYYGFKLGLRISRCGMIIHFPLLPTRPHNSQLRIASKKCHPMMGC